MLQICEHEQFLEYKLSSEEFAAGAYDLLNQRSEEELNKLRREHKDAMKQKIREQEAYEDEMKVRE